MCCWNKFFLCFTSHLAVYVCVCLRTVFHFIKFVYIFRNITLLAFKCDSRWQDSIGAFRFQLKIRYRAYDSKLRKRNDKEMTKEFEKQKISWTKKCEVEGSGKSQTPIPKWMSWNSLLNCIFAHSNHTHTQILAHYSNLKSIGHFMRRKKPCKNIKHKAESSNIWQKNEKKKRHGLAVFYPTKQ